jgi:hypothetical protein
MLRVVKLYGFMLRVTNVRPRPNLWDAFSNGGGPRFVPVIPEVVTGVEMVMLRSGLRQIRRPSHSGPSKIDSVNPTAVFTLEDGFNLHCWHLYCPWLRILIARMFDPDVLAPSLPTSQTQYLCSTNINRIMT